MNERRNPKLLDGYNDFFYYQEWLPTKNGTLGVYSDTPIRFRGEIIETTASSFQPLSNMPIRATGATLETRFIMPFKKKDKILTSLEKNNLGKYISQNASFIVDVKTRPDKEQDINNLRRTRKNDIYVITLS